MTTPFLSVVTGTYNRLDRLQLMLRSVRASIPVGVPYEFQIVDGGSTDGTLDWLRAEPNVQLIEDGELTGAISAFTRGAQAATGRYVLLANDDVVFPSEAILRAILHLEEHPTCGAVAFADDRPMPGKTGHKVMQIAARRGGRPAGANYAQVGLFRRWLGDLVGWWGADAGMKGANTYGGDAYLSARIWELGYSVDAVDGVEVHENMVIDALRQRNGALGAADSNQFSALFPGGVAIPSKPTVDNPDTRLVRVLYLPVYEPGHAFQRQTKRGLREALARKYLTFELDYLAVPPAQLAGRLHEVMRLAQPDVLLMQAGAGPITVDILEDLRRCNPALIIVNWNGDVWERALTDAPVLDLLRHVDLQLVVNASVLPKYQALGIAADYWQIAPEPVYGPLPDVPAYDVVFLANGYSPVRQALGAKLRELAAALGFSFGLYGLGWPDGWSQGDCTYDFATGRALYSHAKLAISDNQFDAEGYVSNRLFEALAADGAVLLQQRVPALEKWTGLEAGEDYVEWTDTADLVEKLATGLSDEDEPARRDMAARAAAFIAERHTFDARVRELFGKDGLLAKSGRRPSAAPRLLRYTGTLPTPFGVVGKKSQKQYVYPGGILIVVPDDAPALLAEQVWEEVD